MVARMRGFPVSKIRHVVNAARPMAEETWGDRSPAQMEFHSQCAKTQLGDVVCEWVMIDGSHQELVACFLSSTIPILPHRTSSLLLLHHCKNIAVAV